MIESRFEVPSWQDKLHKTPYMFRVYAYGCGALILLTVALTAWIVWRGTYTVERFVADVANAPTTLAPLTLSDPSPQTPQGSEALAMRVGGQTINHSTRTVQLGLPQGELPATVGKLARSRFATFQAAMLSAGADSEALILPSADLLAAKADALQQRIVMGLERACLAGWAEAGFRPLREWLLAVSKAAVDAVPPATREHEGMAEAQAYIGHALAYLDAPLPLADASLVRQFQTIFESTSMLAEPRGEWAESAELSQFWKATRALMLPLSPSAARTLHATFRQARSLGQEWIAAQYQRWLGVLALLHGPGSGLVLADSIEQVAPPAHTVSILPLRTWRNSDLLYVVARRLFDSSVASAQAGAVSGSKSGSASRSGSVADTYAQLPDELARAVLLSELERPQSRTSWADWWAWARVPMVPIKPNDTPADAGVANGAEKLLRLSRYKLLRLTGQGCHVTFSRVTEFSLFGAPTPIPASAQPTAPLPPRLLLAEPTLELAHRFSQAAERLVRVLGPAATEASLRAVKVVQAGQVGDESITVAARAGAQFFLSVYAMLCADMGVRDRLPADQRPSPQALEHAFDWLHGGCESDAELTRDVRECCIVGLASSGETVWLGIQGVVLEPVEVTTWDGPVMEPAKVLCMPMLERSVYVTKRDVPNRGLWRVATQFLGSTALRRWLE